MYSDITLVHHLPGRVRFRVMYLKKRIEMAGWLHEQILLISGVASVRLRPLNGSVIIEYNEKITNPVKLRLSLINLDWQHAYVIDYAPELCNGDNLLNVGGFIATQYLPQNLKFIPALALTTPTIIDGLTCLSRKELSVEVLDAVALSLSLLRQDYSAAMLTQVLLSLGEYMEQKTSRSSDELLAELMSPKVTQIWIRRDNEDKQIRSDELVIGDLVLLGPGDTVPADGKIISGIAAINQSSMTGESVPVNRTKGAWVYSGTVIQEGNIVLKAEKVGDDASVARIRKFIIDSLSQRSETQKVTQEMANRRIFITFAVGALVFLLTQNWQRLASVFLVDYSCALKLSTPIAFKSIMYRAANRGLVLKGGRAIEQLAEVDTIVFDKTGTLTHGDMEVTHVVSFDSDRIWAERLLAIAASVEEHSNHPLAATIVRAAEIRSLPHIHHGEVDYVVAHGLVCDTESHHQLIIGSRHFLEEHHQVDFSAVETEIDYYKQDGGHLLFISLDNHLSGMIVLKDHIRPEAENVIAQLRKLGIKHTVLLTGDNELKANQLAQKLDLDEVVANATPEDKVKVVEALQQKGHKVWYVGDGINDAPVLTQAHVGMAMCKSTELAQQAADAVLLEDSLDGVLIAKELSIEAMSLIQSNIKITELVNTGIMLLAAFGYLPPTYSALLHNGTTLGVLLRSLWSREDSK